MTPVPHAESDVVTLYTDALSPRWRRGDRVRIDRARLPAPGDPVLIVGGGFDPVAGLLLRRDRGRAILATLHPAGTVDLPLPPGAAVVAIEPMPAEPINIAAPAAQTIIDLPRPRLATDAPSPATGGRAGSSAGLGGLGMSNADDGLLPFGLVPFDPAVRYLAWGRAMDLSEVRKHAEEVAYVWGSEWPEDLLPCLDAKIIGDKWPPKLIETGEPGRPYEKPTKTDRERFRQEEARVFRLCEQLGCDPSTLRATILAGRDGCPPLDRGYRERSFRDALIIIMQAAYAGRLTVFGVPLLDGRHPPTQGGDSVPIPREDWRAPLHKAMSPEIWSDRDVNRAWSQHYAGLTVYVAELKVLRAGLDAHRSGVDPADQRALGAPKSERRSVADPSALVSSAAAAEGSVTKPETEDTALAALRAKCQRQFDQTGIIPTREAAANWARPQGATAARPSIPAPGASWAEWLPFAEEIAEAVCSRPDEWIKLSADVGRRRARQDYGLIVEFLRLVHLGEVTSASAGAERLTDDALLTRRNIARSTRVDWLRRNLFGPAFRHWQKLIGSMQ